MAELGSNLRYPVQGRRGAVASAHPLATQAGIDILKQGGNAFDAAIAVNAVLQVAQPGMSGVGGDFFCLAYSAKDKKVDFLNGSGKSGAKMTREHVRGQGYSALPLQHGLSVTVPGCVDSWLELNKKHGTLPLKTLLQPAIDLCEHGFALGRNTHLWLQRESDHLKIATPTLLERFYPNGEPLSPGSWVRLPQLADIYRDIAENGRKNFYEGKFGAQIAQAVQKAGGALTPDDLAGYKSTWEDPISTEFNGYQVFETPPNSQGIAVLIALNILKGYDLTNWELDSPELIHHLVEAKKIAFYLRDQEIADPRFVDIPVNKLLSSEHAEYWRNQIRPNDVLPEQLTYPGKGDTTYFCVADKDGNTASCVQSLYNFMGSGIEVDNSGVILHNRGSYFVLDPKSPNVLEPGKRPLHTLTASMTLKDGAPRVVFGTMGGDGQPQTHLQVLLRVLQYGVDIQTAIDMPRWVHGAMERTSLSVLKMEERFNPELYDKMRAKHHKVELLPQWSQDVGHANGLAYDPDNQTWSAGSDLRCDGLALAY